MKITDTWQHGISCYSNHKCRCIDCRSAWAKSQAKGKARKESQRYELAGRMVHPTCTHGTDSSYTNYSCRCIECTEAHREARARRRHRSKIERTEPPE